MIEGAIFDMDGTLLDSMGVWDTLASDYLRSLGYSPRAGLDREVAVMSVEMAAEYFLREYGVPLETHEIVAGINGMLADYYRHTAPLKRGARQFLERLRSSGARLCVATATDAELAEAALGRTGVREYFSAVLTCAEVGKPKTEPEIYRAAFARLGTQKRKTAVFEDALHALDTARRDGFLCVGVYDEHEPRRAELEALADAYIEDFTRAENFWEFAAQV